MEKEYTIKSNFRRILNYIRKENKIIFLLFALYTICAAVLPYFGIIVPKLIIDKIEENEPFKEIIKITLFVGIPILICGFLAHFIEEISFSPLTRIRLNRLHNIIDKIMTIDYPYTEDTNFLDKQNNAFESCNNDTEGFEGSIRILFKLFATVISIIGYVVIIITLNIWILVYLIFNIFVSYYLLYIVKRYRYQKREQIAHQRRKMSYYENSSQDFSFGKDIRLNEMEDNIIKRYDHEVTNFISIFKKIHNKEYYYGFIDLIIILIREGLVYGYLIYSVLYKDMSIGNFTMYFTTVATLSTAFSLLINDVSNYVSYNLYVGDLFKFIDSELEPKNGDQELDFSTTKSIEFKNVFFKYPNSKKYVINDFNLKINKGEKLAIVGINGAGKTTLIKLLCGLYDTYEGEILIDGIELRKFNRLQYFKLFSVVFQNFKIYSMSIKENVALKDNDINDDKVWDSLEKVGLSKKVHGFEKGLDQTLLKVIDPEGIEFSGGENQKLAIARALYKDAPIVILDEPTAALDALAEEEIYTQFNSLVKDKTSIFISHRLSSTKFCDNIVLLGNEGILEYGTHDELLNKHGKYYDMFMVQAQYYQEGEDNE